MFQLASPSNQFSGFASLRGLSSSESTSSDSIIGSSISDAIFDQNERMNKHSVGWRNVG